MNLLSSPFVLHIQPKRATFRILHPKIRHVQISRCLVGNGFVLLSTLLVKLNSSDWAPHCKFFSYDALGCLASLDSELILELGVLEYLDGGGGQPVTMSLSTQDETLTP
jgi:hypothetical protein